LRNFKNPMKKHPVRAMAWLLAALVSISGVATASGPNPVLNPGFEEPVVAAFDIDEPDHWAAHGGATALSDYYVYRPTSDDFGPGPLPNSWAPEGFNVVGVIDVAAGQGISQQLTQAFQVESEYVLSVMVGNTEFFTSFPGYVVQLVAGGEVIASETGGSSSVPAGEFISVNVIYEFNEDFIDLDGLPLEIRLLSGGGFGEVAFDNVMFSAVLADPIADVGGPYFLANPTDVLLLDGTGSLASGDGEIVSYEWDLNNNGEFDDATGATPAAISFSDLRSVYGMVDGTNIIRLKVTDSAGKTAIDEGSVELVTSTKYTGPNGTNNDTWNNPANWDNGIPDGDIDVVILPGANPIAWSENTPQFTGNLTLQNNAGIRVGWGTARPASYHSLGTPGRSVIRMNAGSSIILRTSGSPVIPEIELLADATLALGSSTQTPATPSFDYPITGPYQFTITANNRPGSNPVFNASNSFSWLVLQGDSSNRNQPTYRAAVDGSLGLGNVTLDTNPGNAIAPELWIDASRAMVATGTLFINGDGPTGNGTNRLRIGNGVNMTIAGLVLNGTPLAPGTYGSTGSTAPNKLSWMNTLGTGTITIAPPPASYWDLNGATAGAGGAEPSGVWNSSNAFWNPNPAGTGTAAAWTPGNIAFFSAGDDASGVYEVEVVGVQDIGGLIIGNGQVDFAAGSGGGLRLTSDANFHVGPGISSIETPISQSGTRALAKSGVGDLIISGNLSQTGGTSLVGGTTILSGSNSAASGSSSVEAGILQVSIPGSIPGTARNLTIHGSGSLVFGPDFGSGNIQTALNNRVVAASAGTIAADHHAAADFNFNAAGLSNAYFGAESDVTYTGTLTPQGANYRLSGNGGTLTMANVNALTGSRALTARGNVVLAANNTYTGATTVLSGGSLSILGSSSTSGVTVQGSSTLTLGHNSSLGSGTLAITGAGATLQAVGHVVAGNAVSANADFVVAGDGILEFTGVTTINANRVIASRGNVIFGTLTRDGSSNRNLTVLGDGNTTISGDLTLGTGALTKNDSGVLTLQGVSNYGNTVINSGTLRMDGSVIGASPITLAGARLEFGGEINGGISAGLITVTGNSQMATVGGDRIIANSITLSNNLTFTGNHGLTVGGTLLNNNGNRTITNSLNSSQLLTLGDIDLSQNTANRTLTITGSGNTIVNGVIANGGGSSAGNLTKNGSGTLILNGANTYGGNTVINSGKLFVNGSTGTGNLTIASGATLGGSGMIGGNVTIAAGGNLEFDINSDPASHEALELGTGRSLTFAGGSTIVITGIPDENSTYTLLTAPNGISGSVPFFDVPDGWDAAVSIVGNELRLSVTFIESDLPDPTVDEFLANVAPGDISIGDVVNYTVKFDQPMNVTTVNVADFGNDGTAGVEIGPISAVTSSEFNIPVRAVSTGTLRFRINAGATLRSAGGLNVNTAGAILQANTYNVVAPAEGTLDVTVGSLASLGNLGGPFNPGSRTYTLTNIGGTTLTWNAANSASWLTLDPVTGSLNTGESVVVTATINSNANALPVGTHVDVITFTNITNGNGNTTRNASVTVNGLPVQIIVDGLNRTYDGTPKAVTVTTNPAGLDFILTYNGLEEAPVDAGLYDVSVVITDPSYSGSTNRTLSIARAAQTISFAALDPVFDDVASISLSATSSSGLPVSFTSSNPDVATVSGNTVTIVATGSTTVTASQSGNQNYLPAQNVQRTLNVVRSNPLAVPGGPYTASAEVDLELDGSASLASYEQTIATYEWDLRNNGTYDVTGATPSPIAVSVLQSTYGMVAGINTIQLRVTDTAGKSSTVSTTVTIISPWRWDANSGTPGAQDGSGSWLNPNQWWTGTGNTQWVAGTDGIFGNGGSGAAVGLSAPTSIGNLSFENFSGTYTIGTAGQALTINKGIEKSAGSGIVALNSPMILGGSQTWVLDGGAFNQNSSATIDLGEHTLIIHNDSPANLNRGDISGAGAVIKSGDARLILGSNSPVAAHTFEGGLTLNGGVTMMHNQNIGSGLLTLNGGVLEAYWGTALTRSLGDAPGQMRLIGGSSGFSQNGGGQALNVRVNNSTSFEVVWGSEFFDPDELVLSVSSSRGTARFENPIDLNGADRVIRAEEGSDTRGLGILQRNIRNSSATPAGLTKTGTGLIVMVGANSYNGGTTLEEGTLRLDNPSGLGASTGTLTVNGGLLNINNRTNVTVGNLTGAGGVIANNGNAAHTLIIGNGGGGGGNFHGVIANNTTSSGGTLALTKTGSGAITLSGNNTYTGVTNINQGKLFIDGGTSSGDVNVAAGATLGGKGALGGDTTIANNGRLEFHISSAPGSHDPLNIGGGRTLSLSGSSQLTITLSAGVETGSYVLITGGNNIVGAAPAILNLPEGAEGSVSIVGNEMILELTELGDVTPPTVVSIADNQGGGPITLDTQVIYTVEFDEDIEASTIRAADFFNAGTSAVVIGAVTEVAPGVFSVAVTPTTVGTLQLGIEESALILDLAGNALVTTPVIVAGLTITVNDAVDDPYDEWSGGSAFGADTSGDGIPNGLAWFLGAPGPGANALERLPVPAVDGGKLVLAFYGLKPEDRGDAVFKVQFSSDLGVADPWADNEAEIPGESGTVGDITFHIEEDEETGLLYVEVTMNANGSRMFGRIIGIMPDDD